jgi:hypothetical protein
MWCHARERGKDRIYLEIKLNLILIKNRKVEPDNNLQLVEL